MPEPVTEPEATPARADRGRARRNIWPWVLLGVVFSFTVGVVGSPWLESRVRDYLPAALRDSTHGRDLRVEGLQLRIEDLEAQLRREKAGMQPGPQPALEARVKALEGDRAERESAALDTDATVRQLAQEFGRIRAQLGGGSSQMHDLFMVSVLRRMVAAGRPLGALAPVLENRFRARDAAAVDALLAWSDQPQTRWTLASRIAGLQPPAAAATPAAGGWWARLRARLGGLVRAHDPASPDSQELPDSFQTAADALRAGDLDYAIVTLEKERRSPDVRQWLADARVLQNAELGLDRLEGLCLTDAARAAAEN